MILGLALGSWLFAFGFRLLALAQPAPHKLGNACGRATNERVLARRDLREKTWHPKHRTSFI